MPLSGEPAPGASTPAQLCHLLTSGVYVIGVAADGRRNVFTAAWLTQVSFEPLLFSLSVNPTHFSYPLLLTGGTFVINVLGATQLDVVRHCGTQSGRDVDKLAGLEWRQATHGAPILHEAVAWLECRVTATHQAGDHVLVVAAPVAGGRGTRDERPLRYDETGNIDGSAALYPDRF